MPHVPVDFDEIKELYETLAKIFPSVVPDNEQRIYDECCNRGMALTNLKRELSGLKKQVDDAFVLMNTYAKDPWNMGTGQNLLASVEPQAILAEVYFILAPVSLKLTELVKKNG